MSPEYFISYIPKSAFGYIVTFLKLATKHFAHTNQTADWLREQMILPLIIHDCDQNIIPCAPFESLGSNINKYGGFKSRVIIPCSHINLNPSPNPNPNPNQRFICHVLTLMD